MAYNLKTDETFYHVKLTGIGRQLVSQGTLTFQGFAVGDSEVDYQAADATATELTDLRVLRPVDNQPDIRYPISPAAGASVIAALSGVVGEQHVIQNTAPSRGPFRRATPGDPENQLDTTLPDGDGRLSVVRDAVHVTPDGTRQVVLSGGPSAALVGDWLLVHWIHPGWVPAVAEVTPRYALDKSNPGAYLLYRITDVSGATLTLDREAPRYVYGGEAKPSPAFVLPGGDAIETVYGASDPVSDWAEDQLAFVPAPPVASAEVGLWNCNIIYGEGVMGAPTHPWGGYGSNAYAGTRRYLGYPGAGSPIALLHYSNHVVHNLYGEALVPATVQLNLPSVLWWGDAEGAGGLLLTTSATRQQVTGGAAGFSLVYYALVDGSGRAVGRVYPSLKVLVLDDPELVAALSAKSNRNWTLPPFDYLGAGGTGSTPDNGRTLDVANPPALADLDASTKMVHFTYGFVNDDAASWEPTQGYGLRTALPCQYIAKAKVSLNDLSYFEFKLNLSTLRHFSEAESPTGTGYTANRLVLLFQETVAGVRPVADAWVQLDVTPQLNPAVSPGGTISRAAFDSIYKIDAADLRAARDYALAQGAFYTLPEVGSSSQGLTFGEETVLLGNVTTSIEAVVFRSSFLLMLGEGAYATSSNPTWTPGQPVAITELGIYDANNYLVAVGKLTDPLLKAAAQPLFLDVSLDF